MRHLQRNLKIKQLMAVPPAKHDLQWLKSAVQAALELELSTLPPYLCGLYSLKDQRSDTAKRISEIVFDEMSHFGLACNLAWAIGVRPLIFEGYDAITYPGPLPGGVRPRCNPELRFPCDPDFHVMLGFTDYQSFAQMCMQIEYPEDPVPRPVHLLAAQETFPTIGEFYGAILDAFQNLDDQVPYHDHLDKQLQNDFPDVFAINGLTAAKNAITLIKQEGEGTSKFPFVAPDSNKLSHFYKFGEVYFGRMYIFDSAAQTGDWTGSEIKVSPTYPMTPVPAGGYGPDTPSGVTDCDRAFTAMLQQLDQAWFGGGDAALSDAIDSMELLKSSALSLLKKAIPRPDGGIFGPQFRKVSG